MRLFGPILRTSRSGTSAYAERPGRNLSPVGCWMFCVKPRSLWQVGPHANFVDFIHTDLMVIKSLPPGLKLFNRYWGHFAQ